DPRCTTPAKLEKMVQQLMKKPVHDRRPKSAQVSSGYAQQDNYDYGAPPDFSDEIPF
ncbi:hypothetical protein QEM43_001566, partial [Pseudomonas putida]|nr:hypothetical protein [Pseudomonas putida]